MSDPQLRKDINTLQRKLRAANERIGELEAAQPPARSVPGPVQYVTKTEIKYVKCPKQADQIRKLQAKIGGR